MATLTENQAALESLKDSRNSGVLIARHGDVSITYKTNADMQDAIRQLEIEISAQQGGTRRKIRYIYQPGKGY